MSLLGIAPEGSEPGIDRREQLEATGLDALPMAIAAVETALHRLVGRGASAKASPLVRSFCDAMLRAILAYYVQSGLSVSRGQQLSDTLRAVERDLDGHEVVRTVRLVGFETLWDHLNVTLQLTRVEYLRLRFSAEHVTSLLTPDIADETPARHDLLRRLQETGFDLR